MSDIYYIAGVDEVGRGPLAGPVVAAAVILDPEVAIIGLADSKKLSEKKRLSLSETIKTDALCWALGRAEVSEIDEINILQASLLAMQRAVNALELSPHKALVDGNIAPRLSCEVETIIKGDETVSSISAASIIAKVARDKEMVELDKLYPDYGFARHKGYPTKLHIEALVNSGPSPIHRRSFAPVRNLLQTNK